MKIHKSGKVSIFVATSGGGGGCPTAKVTSGKVRFRDDYYGRIRARKTIAKALFG
jgi:hypothetical protein